MAVISNPDEIFDKVKEIIRDTLGIGTDKDIITLGTTLQDDLGLDSLDAAELTMKCEEHFDIQVSDDDLEKLESKDATIQDVVTCLSKYLTDNTDKPDNPDKAASD